MDQICTLKQMIGIMREEKNKLYLGFMDLQQAYNSINRESMASVSDMVLVVSF